MTIYYMDPVNGSDSNDGLSWGTAKKTLYGNNGASTGINSILSSRTTQNDEVRIAKSPDPVNIGSVTWSDNSPTITFSGCSNLTIDNCESGWTAGLVTPTYVTTHLRQGTYGMQTALTSINGKVAYKSFAAVNYSAYARLTFWINFSTAVNYTAGCPLSLDLCSDSAGNNVVVKFKLPSYYYPANYWVPITVLPDVGYSMSAATAIQSIRISTNGTAITNTIRFDNIQVAKAATDATSLVLTDLIAKDSSNKNWFNPQYIDGTTIGIIPRGSGRVNTPSETRRYYRSLNGTETVTSYKREGFNTAIDSPATSSSTTIGAISATAIANWPNKKLYTGGWNTATDTVDGETWFDGVTGFGYGISQTNIANAAYEIQNISACRYYYNYLVNFADYTVIEGFSTVAAAVSCFDVNNNTTYSSTYKDIRIGAKWILVPDTNTSNTTGFRCPNSLANSYDRPISVTITDMYSLGYESSAAANIPVRLIGANYVLNSTGTLYFSNWGYQCIDTTGARIRGSVNNVLQNGDASGGGGGLFTGVTDALYGKSVPVTLDVSGSIGFIYTESNANNIVYLNSNTNLVLNGTTDNSTYRCKYLIGNGSKHIFKNMKFYSAPYTAPAGRNDMSYAQIQNFNCVEGDHRIYPARVYSNTNGWWQWQTADSYTGNGAWKIGTGASIGTVASAIYLPVGTIACAANSQVTVTIRCKRNGTGFTAGLSVVLNEINAAPITTTSTTSGSYELLTVQFTPTENTTASVLPYVQGFATSSVCYFDDLQVTQV